MPSRTEEKQTGEWVSCATCRAPVYKNLYRLRRDKQHFCSRKCVWKPSPTRDEAVRLYRQGLKLREISEMMQRPLGSIGGMIHRAKVHDRWGTGTSDTTGRNRAKKLLPERCELCGYTRAIDIAHVVGRAQGGTWDISNLLALCPNCHHLFDNGLLTDPEKHFLEEVRYTREK